MQTWWRSVDQLDEDQQKIMDLSADGSFAVTGPPGSGKTNLLLMRGAYLSGMSRNIAILVMNGTLAKFIQSGASGYGVAPDLVMTSRQFIYGLARESGIALTKGLNWKDSKEECFAALKKISADKNRAIYDAILIDEAQDHNEEELSIIRSLTHDLYLTADARQLIYSGGSRDDRFSSLVDDTKVLRFHHRCALDICDLADEIGDRFSGNYTRIAPTSRYPADGPKADIKIVTATIEQQGEKIADRLERQLRAYRGELIGIFAPNRREAEIVAAIIKKRGYGDLMTMQVGQEGYMDMHADRPICVSTLHGAKGLEYRAVHFVAAETVRSHGDCQKRLAFTGVTRAKTALTIYHDRPLPGFFDAAVARWRDPAPAKSWRNILAQ